MKYQSFAIRITQLSIYCILIQKENGDCCDLPICPIGDPINKSQESTISPYTYLIKCSFPTLHQPFVRILFISCISQLVEDIKLGLSLIPLHVTLHSGLVEEMEISCKASVMMVQQGKALLAESHHQGKSSLCWVLQFYPA